MIFTFIKKHTFISNIDDWLLKLVLYPIDNDKNHVSLDNLEIHKREYFKIIFYVTSELKIWFHVSVDNLKIINFNFNLNY
jgi:hypothetical protein